MSAECAREFTVYKKSRLDRAIPDLAKISFLSATYGPKAHPPIYRDISALVHYQYSRDSLRHIGLIVELGRARYPRAHGETAERGTRFFRRYRHDY
jgi:hypothetical protein